MCKLFLFKFWNEFHQTDLLKMFLSDKIACCIVSAKVAQGHTFAEF